MRTIHRLSSEERTDELVFPSSVCNTTPTPTRHYISNDITRHRCNSICKGSSIRRSGNTAPPGPSTGWKRAAESTWGRGGETARWFDRHISHTFLPPPQMLFHAARSRILPSTGSATMVMKTQRSNVDTFLATTRPSLNLP